jgi:hypothetical protein
LPPACATPCGDEAIEPSFPDAPKDQTSDAQLRIRESLDSGFARSLSSGALSRDPLERPGMTLQFISAAALNFAVSCRDKPRGPTGHRRQNHLMKIALLILRGLVLGVLGGAALGVGAGLAWVEIFKTSNFEGYSGMLVFFTFMPLGAVIGGLGGALLFGVIAIRDAEIAIEKDAARRHDG